MSYSANAEAHERQNVFIFLRLLFRPETGQQQRTINGMHTQKKNG